MQPSCGSQHNPQKPTIIFPPLVLINCREEAAIIKPYTITTHPPRVLVLPNQRSQRNSPSPTSCQTRHLHTTTSPSLSPSCSSLSARRKHLRNTHDPAVVCCRSQPSHTTSFVALLIGYQVQEGSRLAAYRNSHEDTLTRRHRSPRDHPTSPPTRRPSPPVTPSVLLDPQQPRSCCLWSGKPAPNNHHLAAKKLPNITPNCHLTAIVFPP